MADPVQRARNLLYVPAVIDVWQLQLEPYVPLIAFAQLQRSIPHDDLVKILYWIAVHPDQGDASAVRALPLLGLADRGVDINEVRGRVGVYAVKLLGRLTGKRPGR